MVIALQIVGLLIFLVVGVMFWVEAWQMSMNQALLCLIPFYLVYFALIKSTRDALFRILLYGSLALIVISPIAAGAIDQLSK